MKKKKKLSNNTLLSLFGSLLPKGSPAPKKWKEIRKESREQYISERISTEDIKDTGNLQ